jgi:hypothetical protein
MAKAMGTHAVFYKPYTTRVSLFIFLLRPIATFLLQVPQGVIDSDETPDRFEFGEIEPSE